MAIANFGELCRGVCEIAGCAVAQMATNEEGAAAISIMLDGIEVMVGHDPQRGANAAFLLTRFGPLPAGQELAATIMLLQINSAMLRAGGPSFGMDPLTGDVLLQQACSFDEATPVSVHQSIVGFVAIACEWQSSHFLSSEDGGGAGGPQADFA